jgi:hypothetical protein
MKSLIFFFHLFYCLSRNKLFLIRFFLFISFLFVLWCNIFSLFIFSNVYINIIDFIHIIIFI